MPLDEGTVRELVEGATENLSLTVEMDGDTLECGESWESVWRLKLSTGAYLTVEGEGVSDEDAALIEAAPDLARTTLHLYTRNAELEDRVKAAEARAEALEKGPDVDALTRECVGLGLSVPEQFLAASLEQLINRAYERRQLNKKIADWEAIVNQDRRKVAEALAQAGAGGEGV